MSITDMGTQQQAGHILDTKDHPGRGRTVRTVAGVGGALAGAAMLLGAAPSTASAGVTVSHGTVHAQGGLKGHAGPSTKGPGGGKYANNSRVNIDCEMNGSGVSGNNHWYLLTSKHGAYQKSWVSAKYVKVTGKRPKACTPGESTPITAKKATHGYEGPSSQDKQTASIKKGSGNEAWCYITNPHAGGKDRDWVAGVESGWIPRHTVKEAKKLPYCSQSGKPS